MSSTLATGLSSTPTTMSPTCEPDRVAGPALVEARDLDAARVREAELARHVARDGSVLTGDAQPAAAYATARHQLADDPLRGVDGDAEADALGAQDDGRVDADDAAARVDERPARVARVEGDVALDDALHRAAVAGAHGATQGADDARRHRRAEAERIADGDDQLPDAKARRSSPKVACAERLAGGANDGEIGRVIDADELRRARASRR